MFSYRTDMVVISISSSHSQQESKVVCFLKCQTNSITHKELKRDSVTLAKQKAAPEATSDNWEDMVQASAQRRLPTRLHQPTSTSSFSHEMAARANHGHLRQCLRGATARGVSSPQKICGKSIFDERWQKPREAARSRPSQAGWKSDSRMV